MLTESMNKVPSPHKMTTKCSYFGTKRWQIIKLCYVAAGAILGHCCVVSFSFVFLDLFIFILCSG